MIIYDLSDPELLGNKISLTKDNINWNRPFGNDDKTLSLINYIENNSINIKKKYVSFINNFCKYKLNKKTLFQSLTYKKNYNLWPMTQFSEKSDYKSKQIINSLKMISLHEILKKRSVNTIVYYGSNKKTLNALSIYCENEKIKLSYKLLDQKFNFKISLNNLYSCLPNILQSLVWIVNFLIKNIRLKKKNVSNIKNFNNSFFIFSNFVHLNMNNIRAGNFFSYQWGNLNKLLAKKKITSIWFHHFIKSPDFLSSKNGSDSLNKINSKSKFEQHFLISEFVDFKIIFKSLKNYLIFYFKSYFILSKINNLKFKNPIEKIIIKLQQDDITTSLCGSLLLQNIIYIEVFNEILTKISKENSLMYLMEGQPWEQALLQNWKIHQGGKSFGYPHTSVNFWHLNYFENFSSIKKSKSFPEYFLISGDLAANNLLQFNLNKNKIIPVENLRYSFQNKFFKIKKSKNKNKVIILGDYEDITTSRLIKVFKKNSSNLYFKPYPAKHFELGYIKQKGFKIIAKPLDEIMNLFETFIVSRSTAASLECYMNDKKVLVFLESEFLNTSPMFGTNTVQYIDKNSIVNFKKLKFLKNKNSRNLLYLDNNLKRWNILLKKLNEKKIR